MAFPLRCSRRPMVSLRHAESCHDVMVTSTDCLTVCHAQDRACIMRPKR